MTQSWTNDVYAISHTGTTDLQNMENNFMTLKSLFSGTTSPSNNVAGQPWFDTSDKNLKIRNNANSAWLAVMYGNSSNKIWMYSNSATDGWTVDSTLADRVLAIKGGSNVYNVNGGNTAGTWTQPNHVLSEAELPAHTHSTNTTGGHSHSLYRTSPDISSGTKTNGLDIVDVYDVNYRSGYVGSAGDHSHSTDGGSGSGNAHNHGTTYRPAAAVGTLQYPTV